MLQASCTTLAEPVQWWPGAGAAARFPGGLKYVPGDGFHGNGLMVFTLGAQAWNPGLEKDRQGALCLIVLQYTAL